MGTTDYLTRTELLRLTPESVMTIGQQALEITMMVSAPILLTALAVGLMVSIFQAATQINEMTLSFIPKLFSMLVMMVVAGPWMLNLMMDYMRRLFTNIPWMLG